MTDREQLVSVRACVPSILIDLPYATKNNFFGTAMYDFTDPLLRRGTVEKLARAQADAVSRGFCLKIWDGFRPYRVQCRMWEMYPDPDYVSNPETGYLGHCRGNTVDVTLSAADGTDLEMPSGFDDFSEKANRDHSKDSPAARFHVCQLEEIMQNAGFDLYFDEWWHFPDSDEYPVIYD